MPRRDRFDRIIKRKPLDRQHGDQQGRCGSDTGPKFHPECIDQGSIPLGVDLAETGPCLATRVPDAASYLSGTIASSAGTTQSKLGGYKNDKVDSLLARR